MSVCSSAAAAVEDIAEVRRAALALIEDAAPSRGAVVVRYERRREGGEEMIQFIAGYDFATRANFQCNRWSGRWLLSDASGEMISGVVWPEDRQRSPFTRADLGLPPNDDAVTAWLPFAFIRDVLSRPEDFDWGSFERTQEGGFVGQVFLPGGMRFFDRFPKLRPTPDPVAFEIGADGRVLWFQSGEGEIDSIEYAEDDPTGAGIRRTTPPGSELVSISWRPAGDPSLFTVESVLDLALDAEFVPPHVGSRVTAAEIAEARMEPIPDDATDERHKRAIARLTSGRGSSGPNLVVIGVGAAMIVVGLIMLFRRKMA